MNREALDEFFAKADDVLADWQPSSDAMVARVEDEDAGLPLADSYYAQASPSRFGFDTWRQRWLQSTVVEQLEGDYLAGGTVTFEIVADTSAWDLAVSRLYDQYERMPPVVEWSPLGFTEDRRWAVDVAAATETPRERALRLRRERNTGPATRHGLDGRFRRRRSVGEG